MKRVKQKFEITSQQLSQVTPGRGALKIKLSKKKPLKINAGAPDGQSETIPMELEQKWGSERIVPGLYVDSTSESTLPTRRSGAPLFISLILPEDDERPHKGTYVKRENDIKGGPGHGLVKGGVTQIKGSKKQGGQRQFRENISSGNGDGGDSSGEIRDFQVKEGDLPDVMVIREEEVMMILTPVMVGVEMILLPQTPLPQGKRNIKVLNMFMSFKDLLDQKVQRVILDRLEEMVGMGKISL